MLTTEETNIAAAQGWLLCKVWCLTTHRTTVQILARPEGPLRNSHDAASYVIERAQSLDPLAIRALRFVMDSLQPNAKAKKKAKRK